MIFSPNIGFELLLSPKSPPGRTTWSFQPIHLRSLVDRGPADVVFLSTNEIPASRTDSVAFPLARGLDRQRRIGTDLLPPVSSWWFLLDSLSPPELMAGHFCLGSILLFSETVV